MKKLIICLVVFINISTMLLAQSKENIMPSLTGIGISKLDRDIRTVSDIQKDESVSIQCRDAFKKDFSQSQNVAWQKTNYFAVATFMNEGENTNAYYDANAKLVGTTSSQKFTALPINAQQYINENYTDFKKGKILFFADNKNNDTNMVLYDTEFDDEDIYFVELSNEFANVFLKVNVDGKVVVFK